MLPALSPHTKHIVIDLQRVFAEPHGWHVPSIAGILPNVLTLCQTTAENTLYSRFITPPKPEDAPGRWQNLYQAYPQVTGLDPAILDLIDPLTQIAQPSQIFDKTTYSIFPAIQPHLGQTDTLILSGAETDACVYASLLSAVDLGLRVIIATDAVTSSDQAAHNATLNIIARRLPAQVECATTAEIIAAWPK
ncbi:isochorismatase family cysteine hydrolase [Cypionkella sp.]|uniref:cysteine hydrolase family protein n=1 Tax=Cypionkella sp. TaxID=2811411 RepID=UPI002ABCA812|nr:isochorismatase family cysteine hydrolase [Cypionkella sp.]MDZ4392205.1 isochorismatase family cysteine hydrolase [Cypionkella sp.]